MSMKKDYEMYLENQRMLSKKETGKYWIEQEKRYVEPFQIYGNLYYVGDSWVCVHLVDTGEGLLLIDAGNCGSEAMLVEAIWEAGFHPAEVKWILLSHGHVDHFGAVNFFRRMFGTRIYMGKPDAEMFLKYPEQSMIQESGNCTDTLFPVDVQVENGDILKFGQLEIKIFLVPGHTKGCISCFFDVFDRKVKKRVGYYGGFGFNTLQEKFLMEIGDKDLKMRREYLNSIQKVRNEKVDIFIGNHTSNVELLKKKRELKENPRKNPFVNEQAWKKFLDENIRKWKN